MRNVICVLLFVVYPRLYTPGPYYLAKLTATLPLNALISLGFILTEYGMFGNRHTVLAVFQVCVHMQSMRALWQHR